MRFDQIMLLEKLTETLKERINEVTKLFPNGMTGDETSFTPQQKVAKRNLELAANELIETAQNFGLIKDK